MNFWGTDPERPGSIVRTSRTADYAYDICEFPHLIVNQARVLDYFAEAAENGPGRIVPDYGVEFVGLSVHDDGEHPVEVMVRSAGEERTIRAKFVVGCDGARSGVRQAIGRTHVGASAAHAWGVMDVLVNTDFPDWRTKCAINSEAGNILHIPREGGCLSRMYIDLGEVADDDDHRVRQTPIEEIIRKANAILSPYTLDVKEVAWHSVYEVGHRLTDRFDDVPLDELGTRTQRVFITGDACHTHSAKAGQGMNVSMQDGFNLAWKLGHVLEGRSPESLLATYSAERQVVAQDLIDFDREWSTLMAKRPEEFADPSELADFYVRTAEFPAGFMTEYSPSAIVGEATHQHLASGFPIGKRFKSALTSRVADANHIHLGHHATADGRWRIYVFADDASPSSGRSTELAAWLQDAPESPLRVVPDGVRADDWFDVKIVYQQRHTDIDLGAVPPVFLPRVGPFDLIDYEKVYAVHPEVDIFEERGIDRDGAIVVVRPDQYVAHVLPLTATAELAAFFDGVMGRETMPA